MIALPAMSPRTCTMRRAEWAASCATASLPCEVAVERHAVAQQVVDARRRLAGEAQRDVLVDEAGADRDRVGGVRFGVSPSPTAAAMPPCAQALEAPSPSGAAEMTVTGRGASFSAQNRPARPPPTMTTSSMSFGEEVVAHVTGLLRHAGLDLRHSACGAHVRTLIAMAAGRPRFRADALMRARNDSLSSSGGSSARPSAAPFRRSAGRPGPPHAC